MTSGGKPVTLTLSRDDTHIEATAGGEAVFSVILDEQGGVYTCTFRLYRALDHVDRDRVDVPVHLTVTDADGDSVSGTFTVGVTDDGPIAVDEETIVVDEGDEPRTETASEVGGGADPVVRTDGNAAAVSQAIMIDFGAAGDGSVMVGIPPELLEKGLTSAGEDLTYAVSDDGWTLTATAGETPVFTVELNEEGGAYSYTFRLRSDLDHPLGRGASVIEDIPFTLAVTDSEGMVALATVAVDVVDGVPVPKDVGSAGGSPESAGSSGTAAGAAADASTATQGVKKRVIPLAIDTRIAEAGGAEILAVTISGVPKRATLSAGLNNGDGSWTLTLGDLVSLTITPSAVTRYNFELGVFVTSMERATGDIATTESKVRVVVDEEAETLDPESIASLMAIDQGDEDVDDDLGDGEDVALVTAPLDVAARLDGLDPSVVHFVTVSGLPEGARLNVGADNGDGTWSLSGEDLQHLDGLEISAPAGVGDVRLSVSVASTDDEAARTATIDVTLLEV